MIPRVILNSTVSLSSALLLTILLHELAHYTMSILLGYDATLYHNRVLTMDIASVHHEILVAGIAPVFSLVVGLVSYYISTRSTPSHQSLYLLWLGIAGVITFCGYMMIAPLIPVGDTGKVFALLGVPMMIQVVVAVLSLVAVTLFLIKSTSHFERFAIEDFGSTKATRSRWALSLILFPLLISIALVTVLQFPVQHFASILGVVCAPFSIMAVFGTFMGSSQPLVKGNGAFDIGGSISWGMIVFLVGLIIANRLLVSGVG